MAYIDDVSLPLSDKMGDQRPIELIRQIIDNGGYLK